MFEIFFAYFEFSNPYFQLIASTPEKSLSWNGYSAVFSLWAYRRSLDYKCTLKTRSFRLFDIREVITDRSWNLSFGVASFYDQLNRIHCNKLCTGQLEETFFETIVSSFVRDTLLLFRCAAETVRVL